MRLYAVVVSLGRVLQELDTISVKFIRSLLQALERARHVWSISQNAKIGLLVNMILIAPGIITSFQINTSFGQVRGLPREYYIF